MLSQHNASSVRKLSVPTYYRSILVINTQLVINPHKYLRQRKLTQFSEVLVLLADTLPS